MDLETSLKNWCDKHLVLGKCFGGNKDGPITTDLDPETKKIEKRSGNLVYQDGTSCSASYAFADIYLLDDNTYTVYVACGYAMSTGGEREVVDIKPQLCNNLEEVLDYLVCFCGHDPNTTGEMMLSIIQKYKLDLPEDATRNLFEKIKIPVFKKCGNNKDLIEAINKY